MFVKGEYCFQYFKINKERRIKSFDNTVGLVCDSWPDESMEWFTRNQKHDWSSKSIISKIRKEDCHVVPVGDPTSQDRFLEWRFSFLLPERQLMWSLNDAQIQCYVIMKLLIKKKISLIVPDETTSYHLKTVIF